MENKEIVLSGIRATGNLHLGNYYGALNKFVKMQDDYDCLYFIADLHALTTNPDPKALHENVQYSYRAMFPRSPRCTCCSTCT